MTWYVNHENKQKHILGMWGTGQALQYRYRFKKPVLIGFIENREN
jgi:hypothetical protein